jgi:predicted O-linked N-acetylglucosamine transferase (SPINDLY family)
VSAVSDEHLESALRCHERGDYAGAEQYYLQALAADPDNVQAVHSAGVLALQANDFPLASARLRRAIELGTNLAGTHMMLGRALRRLGDIDGAIASCRRAIERDPDFIDARIMLGLALKDQGQLDEAARAYRSALAINPASFEARLNLANVLQLQRQFDAALIEYLAAEKLSPDSTQLHYNFGKLLRAQGVDAAAVGRFQQAVRLDGDNLDAYYDLGQALTGAGYYTAAVDCFRHLQNLLEAGMGCPVDPAARARLRVQTSIGLIAPLAWSHRYDEALPILRSALADDPDSLTLLEYWLLILPYRCEGNAEFMDAYRCYRDVAPARLIEPIGLPPRERSVERLRIGYVSGDFRDHSISFFLEPIMANHDRHAFEVICYSTNARDDAVTERFAALADRWVSAKDMDDTTLAQRIADDGVDILIDLSGRTKDNRLGMFALRPAPLQVAYLGYPTYTGILQLQYRLTDTVIDPSEDDRLESERPLYLPRGMFCYRPPTDAPEIHRLSAQERGYICFGSFNQLQKLSPTVLSAWIRILTAVPGSRLLLKALGFNDPAACRRIEDTFTQAGIAPGRVMIRAGALARQDHLAQYNEMDIALDTFPYNGTTTTCEALWMGVPVLTLAGGTHPARVGASLLGILGLPELVAHSVDEYVDKAVGLAGDRVQLDQWHGSLRDRFKASPLRDEAGFTRAFEHALREAWKTLVADRTGPVA